MTLEQLRIFVAVAEREHMTQAAQQRAFDALDKIGTLSIQGANFKQSQYQFAVTSAQDDLKTSLTAAYNAGDLTSKQIDENVNVWKTTIDANATKINADVNGSYNILRKVVPDVFKTNGIEHPHS